MNTPEEHAEAFLRDFAFAGPEERTRRIDAARALAQEVKRAGVDLCMSRATEFSPRIAVLFLAAAKLAFIGYGTEAEMPPRFVDDLRRDAERHAEFRRFVDASRE